MKGFRNLTLPIAIAEMHRSCFLVALTFQVPAHQLQRPAPLHQNDVDRVAAADPDGGPPRSGSALFKERW